MITTRQKRNRKRMMTSVPQWVVAYFDALAVEQVSSREVAAGRFLEAVLTERGIGPGPEQSEAEHRDSD